MCIFLKTAAPAGYFGILTVVTKLLSVMAAILRKRP